MLTPLANRLERGPSRPNRTLARALLLSLMLGQTSTALGARKPNGWWCQHLLGQSAMESGRQSPYKDMRHRPGGFWSPDRIGKALRLLNDNNVPLYTTYLKQAQDRRADRLLCEYFQQPTLTLSKLLGAVVFRYRSVPKAMLEYGVFSQSFGTDTGNWVGPEDVVRVFAELVPKRDKVLAADLLSDKVPELAAASALVTGRSIAGPTFWAWSRLHYAKISEPMRLAQQRASPFDFSLSQVDLDRQQSIVLVAALIQEGFRLGPARPIGSALDRKIEAIAMRVVNLPARSRDIRRAAEIHFGSWRELHAAARGAHAHEASAASVVELHVGVDGKGRYETVRGSRAEEAHDTCMSVEFWERANTAIESLPEHHAVAARLLIDRITEAVDVLDFQEAVEILGEAHADISVEEAEQIMGTLAAALRPAA